MDRIERGEFHLHMNDIVYMTVNPFMKHGVYVEANMENISKMIPINISNDLNPWKTCSLVWIVLLKRYVVIPPCLRNLRHFRLVV